MATSRIFLSSCLILSQGACGVAATKLSPSADEAKPNRVKHAANMLLKARGDITKGKTWKDLEQSVVEMVQGEHTTEMAALLGAVEELVQGMKSKTVERHWRDNTTITELLEAFATCSKNISAAATDVKQLQQSYQDARLQHKTCREEESVEKQPSTSCQRQLAVIRDRGEELCDTSDQKRGISLCESLPHEDAEAYLVRMVAHMDQELASYKVVNASCDKVKRRLSIKRSDCDRKHNASDVKKAQCDKLQMEVDSTACSWAHRKHQPCQNYQSCYDRALEAYDIGKASVLASQNSIKKELRLAESTLCLISGFVAHGKMDTAQIKACKPTSVSSLDLQIPEPPASSHCQVLDEYPCTPEYTRMHRKGLPSDINLVECTPCAEMQSQVESKSEETAELAEKKLEILEDCADDGTWC